MCGVVLVAESLEGRGGAHILPLALSALARLGHRGAVDADGRTGDGAGVLTQIPFDVFRPELAGLGGRDVAVGMIFLPADPAAGRRARRLVAESVAAQELLAAGWRAVPTDPDVLGAKARASQPRIEQLFVIPRMTMTPDEFEARLFRARRDVEARGGPYIVSLSHRTIVYKALVRSVDLAAFYPDLRHPAYKTSFAIAHQRFSTNTSPSWSMAQPFRLLAHNGEINTLAGNRNALRARGFAVSDDESDSASLDNALSLLTNGGRKVPEAMRTMIEQWEGPALVAFSDGRVTGAALDRNGLRPARYVVTRDGLLALASEAGVFDIDESSIVTMGRLGPGEMIAVDLGAPASRRLERRRLGAPGGGTPPGQPPGRRRAQLSDVVADAARQAPFATRGKEKDRLPSAQLLRAFGYTRDELQLVLGPMYKDGVEPIASMGDDTPLAVLSPRPRLLFSYFKQRFAQVTNPPIDPLREALVMSLETDLGEHVRLATPLLRRSELRSLLSWQRDGWSARKVSLLFERDLPAALDALLSECARAVRDGVTCLVLSDRGVDAEHAAIPSLLAISAVHHHLVREGLRLRTSLIADASDARDDHHLAALLGYGADAVCPYLALELISGIVCQESGSHEAAEAARRRYRGALTKGLLKILSKMGVSSIRSYRGAQLFESVGLGKALIDAHFPGTPSFVDRLTLDDVARQLLERHRDAFASDADGLEEHGLYRYRRGGEPHAYDPDTVKALRRGDLRAVDARAPIVLRDLYELRPAGAPLPVDEVEPVEAIVKRFMTSAMSLGALSPEAQEALAIAMNRLGARSNSGEGGALPEQAREASHRIKQVASARFGVTAAYLVDADELQIKIAQGSKPGEGGQLPGAKVTELIARVRHATAGTPLISPPPHHDIYSIEDLAQLVADLKQVNPRATVSVKLVSSAGIGTIAVGVAKAHADAIEISGHDGGTGASPIGSIRNAGLPWELGLAEAHQALVRAGLRDRVRLQVNGGLKTGRDVVIAALHGADEFGFGTAALVALGCVMARQCHLDSCPTGIATQRDELRAKFRGTPDDVIRYFTAVAEEVREILATLGMRTLVECGGHAAALTAPSNTLDAKIIKALGRTLRLSITNAERAVGAGVAGHLARHPGKSVAVKFRGAAGQSFGAFCVDGMRLELHGVANDGVGKGMSGGEIVIRSTPIPDAVLAGNAVLYGATGGRLFLGGRAGERFAVRNSGAVAVVEGTGDHACEYMTAGVVAILGTTGVNVGAGMTGGTLFVLDAESINRDSVVATDLSADDELLLRELLAAHRVATGSAIHADLARFRRVVPIAAYEMEERVRAAVQ
jgi:glutamate synthase (ferredoxin)